MQYLKQVGGLTVIPKPEKRNTIPEDFGINPEYEGIPYDLVIDGVIMEKNLKEIGRDLNWLKKEVRKIWYKSRTSINSYIWWKGTNFLSEKRKVWKIIYVTRKESKNEKRINNMHYSSNCNNNFKHYNVKPHK